MNAVRSIVSVVLIAVAVGVLAWGTAAPGQVNGMAETGPQPAEPPPQVPSNLRSPRATMQTFLDAMDRYEGAGMISPARIDAVETIRSTMDLSRAGRDQAERAAINLLAVFNRTGRINAQDLPSASIVQEQEMREFVFFPNPSYRDQRPLIEAGAAGEIVFAKGPQGGWRFSADTIDGAQALYESVQRLPIVYGTDERSLSTSHWIRSQIPRDFREAEMFGVEAWQWLGILAVVLVSVLLDLMIQLPLRALVRRQLRKIGNDYDTAYIDRAVRPFGLFMGALFVLIGLRVLGLPPFAQQVLFTATRLVLMVAGVLSAFRIVDVITDLIARRATATETKVDDLLVPLVQRALKILVIVIGLIYIADSLSIEILPLLTGLGLGGLAVAFAAKDTIENFFGSIAVIFDRPFEVGHWVVIGDVEGHIEKLGFRSTRVRTFYNSLVTVPNATLVRATVDNYGRRKYRRYSAELSLTYDTPPEKIDAFCEGIRELIRHHPYTRKDFYQVAFKDFGSASLQIMFYVFFEAPDWPVEMRERHRLLNDVLRLAHKLGVEFAFPTQTLYLKRGSEGLGEQPADFSAVKDTQRESTVVGRSLARSLVRNAGWRTTTPGLMDFPGAEPIEQDPESDSQVEQRRAGG